MLHTCTSLYAYAATLGSSCIFAPPGDYCKYRLVNGSNIHTNSAILCSLSPAHFCYLAFHTSAGWLYFVEQNIGLYATVLWRGAYHILGHLVALAFAGTASARRLGTASGILLVYCIECVVFCVWDECASITLLCLCSCTS